MDTIKLKSTLIAQLAFQFLDLLFKWFFEVLTNSENLITFEIYID